MLQFQHQITVFMHVITAYNEHIPILWHKTNINKKSSSNRIFKNMLEFQERVTGFVHIITAHNDHIPNCSTKLN
jgi:hypothetical protein